MGNKVGSEKDSPLPRRERGGGQGERRPVPLSLSLSPEGRGDLLPEFMRAVMEAA